MGTESNSWYIVKYHSNKYNAILFDNYKKCNNFANRKGLSFKGFRNKEEAIQFAGCKESKILFQVTEERKQRICLCCEKPFYGRTKLCPSCNKLRGNISVRTVVTIKSLYPEQNVFKTIADRPSVVQEVSKTITSKERSSIRAEKALKYKSSAYLERNYKRTDIIIPDYVKTFFEKDNTKEFLYIEGEKLNPKIYYRCKRCYQEQCQRYVNLKAGKGHNCEATKSSGEAIIEEYLKEVGVDFKVQYDTMKCINPKTLKVMPYDFEITEKKIIIEVQGEQHNSYITYFHGSVENFDYQMWKDSYKRNFAENQGYKVIEIWYSDLETGKYKFIINKAIGI